MNWKMIMKILEAILPLILTAVAAAADTTPAQTANKAVALTSTAPPAK